MLGGVIGHISGDTVKTSFVCLSCERCLNGAFCVSEDFDELIVGNVDARVLSTFDVVGKEWDVKFMSVFGEVFNCFFVIYHVISGGSKINNDRTDFACRDILHVLKARSKVRLLYCELLIEHSSQVPGSS